MDNTQPYTNATDRQRLLIVDDDADWTNVLQLYFLEKYDVIVVNSAEAALTHMQQSEPDALIIDLVMPMMDGFGVMQRLHDGGKATVPTILLTGWKTAEVEQCANSFGCAAVLAKPVELSVLEQTILAVVGSKQARSASLT
jgi:two-component system, response regulator, stage 0 sporulation protein A